MTINLLRHTTWNLFKDGGDTITKLIDNVQERQGIRSDSNAALTRLLVYFAIAFHRGKQWCNAKEDFMFYPTPAHARNANDKRECECISGSSSNALLASRRGTLLRVKPRQIRMKSSRSVVTIVSECSTVKCAKDAAAGCRPRRAVGAQRGPEG